MGRDCPCFKCEDREIGCHDKCKKYGIWKKENDEIRSERLKESQKNAMFYDIEYQRSKRCKK